MAKKSVREAWTVVDALPNKEMVALATDDVKVAKLTEAGKYMLLGLMAERGLDYPVKGLLADWKAARAAEQSAAGAQRGEHAGCGVADLQSVLADNIYMTVCDCGCGRVTLHLRDQQDRVFAHAFVDAAMLEEMRANAVFATEAVRETNAVRAELGEAPSAGAHGSPTATPEPTRH